MKTLTVCTALAGVLALAACQPTGDGTQTADAGAPGADAAGTDASAPAGDITEASLRAGLWEMSFSMPDSGREAPSFRMCTDGSRSAVADSTQLPDVEDCSQSYSREPDGLHFTSRCTQTDGTVTETNGTITGDFETTYRMEATVATSGSPVAPTNGTRHVVTTASYQGACPDGWTPGDVEMAGMGVRVNANRLREGMSIDPDQLREMAQRRSGH